MNLKSRIGDLLLGRQSGPGQDAPDSVAAAREIQQQQDEAARLHMRRLAHVRNRELNDLRALMLERAQSLTDQAPSRTSKHASKNAVTRPSGLTDVSQMVSLINELEVKVLSEPMGLVRTALPPPAHPANAMGTAHPPTRRLTTSHPLDDAALMVAARQWHQAGDLLISALDSGELPKGLDWATRCAIDLLERGNQVSRADELRQKYKQDRGCIPARVLPPRLSGPSSGRVQASSASLWKCESQLDAKEASSLQALVEANKACGPLVLDWSNVSSIDSLAMAPMQRAVETAMRCQTVFIHIGLLRLIRAARKELHAQMFSAKSWKFWLTLMNWNGFRSAHRIAAAAFSKRFECESPAYLSAKSLCQSLNTSTWSAGQNLVSSARFLGDLSRDQVKELDELEAGSLMPGGMVLLDFRLLTSVDFFFGADLLNWVIRQHARGQTVCITYAHPLLTHFLQMLGLQEYAKLHCLPNAQRLDSEQVNKPSV